MKAILSVVLIYSFLGLNAQNTDSLSLCFNQIQEARASIEIIETENVSLKNKVVSLSEVISTQDSEIDSLKEELISAKIYVMALADSLNINITNARSEIQANSDSLSQAIKSKSQLGLWIFIAIALVLIIVAFVLGKLIAKRKNEVESLSAKADKLNEEIVNRLSTEMSDMQAISKQISALASAPGATPESEQKLITTLADRITFMEMTLYKMDSSVRGHKQLSRSINQMKDNLLANGYELVDMLGKDYHDGMKVTANFVEDEELPEGKQIITGIIKPQINYKGKMIQSAQITVSQNI